MKCIGRKSGTAFIAGCCVALGMVAAKSAFATESWQNTNVTVGYTTESKFDPVFGTGTADKKLTTVRLEHFGVHEYGDNYFFFDTYHGKEVGSFFGFGAGFFQEMLQPDSRIYYATFLMIFYVAWAALIYWWHGPQLGRKRSNA